MQGVLTGYTHNGLMHLLYQLKCVCEYVTCLCSSLHTTPKCTMGTAIYIYLLDTSTVELLVLLCESVECVGELFCETAAMLLIQDQCGPTLGGRGCV